MHAGLVADRTNAGIWPNVVPAGLPSTNSVGMYGPILGEFEICISVDGILAAQLDCVPSNV